MQDQRIVKIINVLHHWAYGWTEELGVGSFAATILVRILVLVFVLLLALLTNIAVRRYLLKIIQIAINRSRSGWDDLFFREKVFDRSANFAPAIIIYTAAPLIFPAEPTLLSLTQRIASAYMILLTSVVIHAVLRACMAIYETYPISKDRPIKAYLQVVILLVYCLAAIFTISHLIDESPWALLSGLGAMTAILMLVFRDSILGFVASIQLVANNMVRAGDWIEMPKYGADGAVVDVSLATVKIQNWDKTITTIPTYALLSDSFKNWRGMSESGGRRIKRSINIDLQTVCFCDEEMLARFKNIDLLTEHLKTKRKKIDAHNIEAELNLINGRRLTNIGVFRAYIEAYLLSNPNISQEMTFLVRQLAPSETGLPIEIYVFSCNKEWVAYEGIQSDIFDHLLAIIPEFGLRVFQSPSGQDFKQLVQPRAELPN